MDRSHLPNPGINAATPAQDQQEIQANAARMYEQIQRDNHSHFHWVGCDMGAGLWGLFVGAAFQIVGAAFQSVLSMYYGYRSMPDTQTAEYPTVSTNNAETHVTALLPSGISKPGSTTDSR